MSTILVIEDDVLIREETIHQLSHMKRWGTPYEVETLELNETLIAERAAYDICRRFQHQPSYSVLVLDLHLGHRADDGLMIMRYLKHCFDGAVVIHSSQIQHEDVRQETRKLGIRFGTAKNSPDLPELVEAAMEVAFVRSAVMGDALFHSRNPIPEYDLPEGTPDLDELFLKLKRLGRTFDGTSDSVDWEGLPATQELVRQHVEAAKQQGYARFYRENPDRHGLFYDFFEDWVINAIPVLHDLEKTFRRTIATTEKLVSF